MLTADMLLQIGLQGPPYDTEEGSGKRGSGVKEKHGEVQAGT